MYIFLLLIPAIIFLRNGILLLIRKSHLRTKMQLLGGILLIVIGVILTLVVLMFFAFISGIQRSGFHPD